MVNEHSINIFININQYYIYIFILFFYFLFFVMELLCWAVTVAKIEQILVNKFENSDFDKWRIILIVYHGKKQRRMNIGTNKYL